MIPVLTVNVKPFIVTDSAFPLASTCMKCHEIGQPAYRHSFNYSLIRTSRVVEQAFGQLKGRWKIMDGKCSLKDPVFVRRVAVVCCALHNNCERHQCIRLASWGTWIHGHHPNLKSIQWLYLEPTCEKPLQETYITLGLPPSDYSSYSAPFSILIIAHVAVLLMMVFTYMRLYSYKHVYIQWKLQYY